MKNHVKGILVIEDNAPYRQILRIGLTAEGYEVMTAPDGRQGLESLHEHPCALVITDIYMPEQEGLETIRRLKQEAPTVKIIAMSGGGSRNAYGRMPGVALALETAQLFGADRTLSKPFELQELVTAIEELIG